ncbi:MAG: chromosome segregation protein SMC [Planctomycetes bacterium]|nr:chromosome segregation protein SMC [Planctomycetota bacterium]
MRLKRLETYGFKSFADRMEFDFENGITAVIGPNGCGKSNIVDSIKWVIGEQSAKALRGEDMTDVIFNGCSSRRAMAFAEVTLVLDQLGGHLGIEGDEVAMTRRLSRDGQSGYFLNGKPCRLKDIKELFMDTGIGTSAYSVIEQGRVGFIVDANTKDRRAILEEAAGISRYKARRKVALRKLERVELDLQRIGEVLAEVRRRVKAVTRQAAAALRYRELTGQLRELRLAFALEEYGKLTKELAELAGRGDELSGRSAELAAGIGGLEAALIEADTRLVTLEAQARELEQQRGDAQSRRDVSESKARDAKYRLVEIDQHEAEDKQALVAIGGRIAGLSEEKARAEQGLADAGTGGTGGDTALTEVYREKREILDRVLAEADALIAEVETRKSKQVECLRDLARIAAEKSRLDSSRVATGDRRRRLEERSGGQLGALATAQEAEKHTRGQLDGIIVQAADLHTRLDDGIRARETALAEGTRLDAELNDIRHSEARFETSMRLLQEQERRAEGVFRGVKDVLQHMDKMPGIRGMVADLCRVPDNYVVAIEVALGSQAQNIVTETQHAAKDAIDFLKRERRGRATFLPLDDIQGGERVPREALREKGVVGVASRLIEYADEYRNAFEFLLGNVLVVESLDDAIALRRKLRLGCRLVTIDGDVINAGGAMTGGRQQGGDGGGLVSRKNEIRKSEEALAELSKRRLSVGQARDAAKKQGFDLSLAVEDLRKAIQATDRNAGEAKAQLMKAERDRIHLEEGASSFGAELEEISSEIAKLDAEAKELTGQDEWFGAVNRTLAGEIEQISSRLTAKAAQRNQLQEEVNNLRVDLATTQERQEALRNQLGHISRAIQEQEDQRGDRERRLAGHAQKREELKAQQAENAAIYAAASEQFNRFAEGAAGVLGERDRLRNDIEERRQELRALQGRGRGIDAEKQQVELKAGEAKVRLEGLAARVLEDYQFDLADAFTNYQRPEDADWPALRKQLVDTEKELAEIGPVNLAAIDELEEVQAREAFLDKQFADLGNASAKLTEIIEHINDISRKLFQDTYREVRANFQALFRKLFNGGKADLLLETQETLPDGTVQKIDLLEAGIEIMAQPPGKHPKIITQLSGGEKALTAIALLFAVYQSKPSPFCILDEVDAPLDDSNTDVYCNMLREFVRDSQFIVITHNKNTMKHADAIYGITQNEPGVSTKVSVKFEEVAEGSLDLTPTTHGAGPYA